MRRLAVVPQSRRWITALAVVIHLALALPAAAQETRYIYDPLGRLVGVVNPDGQLTLYDYDAAGNLLAIRRIEPEEGVAITLVTPDSGLPGTSVEIFGAGFSAAAAENQIAFNGTPAEVLAATATRLLTRVPDGATSGFITVSAPAGSAESPERFAIPSIAIAPTAANVQLDKTRQFTAIVAESTDQRVTWAVNGIDGGNATVGTITLDGLYRAPSSQPPNPTTVQIRARSLRFPMLFADASVEVIPPMLALVTAPAAIHILRPAAEAQGGMKLNALPALPSSINVTRPASGGPGAGGLTPNVSVAGPPFIAVMRPGIGDPNGLALNLILARPPSITVTRPGAGETQGLPANVTVAQPHNTQIRPE